MIGDNYVTGDNLYLRELQNFFFEVLGMMSVTHYGAIGDGRTDCYGALQVAIDDANRRNLNYIYVPYGRYIYTGELINIGTLKFVGNPKAQIVNIRTGAEIPITQFGIPTSSDYYTKEEVDALLAQKEDKQGGDQTVVYYRVINDLSIPVTLTATPISSTTWTEELTPEGGSIDINLLRGSCLAEIFSELYYTKQGSETRYYFDMLTPHNQDSTLHIT